MVLFIPKTIINKKNSKSMKIALTFLLIFLGVLFILLLTYMVRKGTIKVDGTSVQVMEETEETNNENEERTEN